MIDIDYIMELLDWHRSASDQAKGIALAENVQNFNVFLQPCQKNFNINVWENCAKIISKRTDEELTPYLTRLMEWLQDLNWPGATMIADRLKQYQDDKNFNFCYNECLKRAEKLDDEMWAEWLQLIRRETV